MRQSRKKNSAVLNFFLTYSDHYPAYGHPLPEEGKYVAPIGVFYTKNRRRKATPELLIANC